MAHQKFTLTILLFFLIPFNFIINAEAKDSQTNIRLYILGLSLLPPPGKDWTHNIVHPGRIEFGKLGNSKFESFLASAFIHKIPITTSDPEFLKKISKIRWEDKKNQKRFKILKTEEIITHEKEDICIRYHTKYEDYGSKYLSKNIPYFVVEDIGLICRYPGKKDIGISIGISQRAEPSKLVDDFETIANTFIENSKFEPFPENINN